ncbi:MAG: hypothetical protein J7K94_00430 [Dehalococcoidia bacterium]|nr:hypothetical protein [Dehalococcoidia bacterium]
MWRRKSWRFYFGLPPVGFYFRGLKSLPEKQEYLGMLQDYKEELLEEIKEVEMEIEEVKKNP